MLTLAEQADTETIAALNRQFHLNKPDFYWDTPEWIAQQIDKNHYFIQRDTQNTIVAAVCVPIYHGRHNIKSAKIEAIAVLPDMRRKKIGQGVVEEIKEKCQSLSVRTLTVYSFAEYGLDRFYESCGFTKDGYNHFSLDLRPARAIATSSPRL